MMLMVVVQQQLGAPGWVLLGAAVGVQVPWLLLGEWW
jgi:hypothetical protein